ncbi:hypothetical protein ACN28S_67030 [Cystobacter fuscus]
MGLSHHNLKPENVLFDIHGNAKLGDFGLSRVVEQDASRGLPQVFVGAGGMVYRLRSSSNRSARKTRVPPPMSTGWASSSTRCSPGRFPAAARPCPPRSIPRRPPDWMRSSTR